MTSLTITLPHAPRELSPNGRCHWAKKSTLTRRAKGMARVRTFEALQTRKFKPTAYRVTWFYKGCRGDVDNQLARCKAYLDGACAAMGIDDVTLSLGSVTLVHDMERAGTLEITFTK